MEKDKLDELSFEEALNQLELIVKELESGRTKLDDAVNAYEKAMKLKQLCETKLKSAQLKIEKLDINSSDEVKSSEFEVPEN